MENYYIIRRQCPENSDQSFIAICMFVITNIYSIIKIVNKEKRNKTYLLAKIIQFKDKRTYYRLITSIYSLFIHIIVNDSVL